MNGTQVSNPSANKLDLGGVVALVAPLVATIGLFKATGSIGRLQRDDATGLIIAVSLVLAAGILLTAASYISGQHNQGTRRVVVVILYILGIGACVGGFGFAVGLVITNTGEQPRPQITASLNQSETRLSAKVTSSNLATEDRLEIKVDLARLKQDKSINKQFPFAPKGSLPLQRSFIGPDDEGNVLQELSLPLPAARQYTDVVIKAFTSDNNESCTEQHAAGTACLFLTLDPDRGHRRAKRSGR